MDLIRVEQGRVVPPLPRLNCHARPLLTYPRVLGSGGICEPAGCGLRTPHSVPRGCYLRSPLITAKSCAPPGAVQGYAPLLQDWENFYTRRLYHRIVDCWNRPIGGPPFAGKLAVVDRESTNGNFTFQ